MSRQGEGWAEGQATWCLTRGPSGVSSQPSRQVSGGRMFQTEHTQTCNGGAGVLGECRRGLEGPSGDGVQAGLGMGLSLGLGVAQPPTASVSLKDPPSRRTLLPAREPRPGRFGV